MSTSPTCAVSIESVELIAQMTERYGSGPYVAHRKDTINALLDGCDRSRRVHFHLGEQITELDFDGVRLRRKDGSWAD